MQEIIMFIKLTEDESCIVLSFFKDKEVYIHQAYTMDRSSECIDKAKELLFSEEKDYPISLIVFDGSLFIQEGLSFRKEVETEVRIYSNKKKFEYRVINQIDYIKDFIFRKTQTLEYAQFMTLYKSFSQSDKYNTAVDILCDISRYYRARNQY